MHTPSCKYLVLPFDTILPLQLQPGTGSSCNWYTLRVASTKFFRLILYPFSCNPIVVRVAIDIHSELQILSAYVWYYTTPSVATRQWFELQILSASVWYCTTLLLQSDSGSSCNWYTLRVASTKFFRLILYPFSCNPIVVRAAIDIHSELQILSAYVWYYTTPSVATRQWFELQSIYTFELQILSASVWYCTTLLLQSDIGSSCNWYTLRVASTKFFRLILYPFSCNPDSGSSCNWYTVQVANTKFFLLILYPFSCNQIVGRVAIDIHFELQILSASVWYCTTPSVATRQWFELQSMYTSSYKYWVLPLDIV
jgi:multisubunit Na+/H+ antiporter MnhE subunit